MNSILRRIRADSQIGRNELLAECELTAFHISLELKLLILMMRNAAVLI